MKSSKSEVAIMVAMSVMAVSVIGGCSKHDASKPEMMTEHSGMMMTGNMEKDMQMMGSMMVKELGPKDANFEDRFIDLMIPHHEAAIAMAKDAMGKSNRAELKQMAQEIITAQEKEITQMKEWRQQWYGH